MFVTIVLWILIAIGLPIVLFRTQLGAPRAIKIGEDGKDNQGAIRRSVKFPKELLTKPAPDVSTVYDILRRAVRLNPNKNILGGRSLVRIVEEEKEVTKVVAGVEKKEIKKWKYFELSKYSWLTYAQVNELANAYGRGFRALGLKPGEKLTIFASTSRDWMIMALSAFTQSITITTAYDTLGEEGLSFSLNECEITTLFTNADLLPMIPKIAPKVKTLKNIIYNGVPAPASTLDSIKASFPHLRLVSLDELKSLGEANPVEIVPPKADDLACIMYTSGTTGNPKGVMIAHSAVVAAVAGSRTLITEVLGSEEYYLAYLPLAHILEFSVECMCLFQGVSIGYGSVKTLTDASVRNCSGDIKELRPTLMAGVPAVWELIRKGVNTKLREASATQQKIFDFAYEFKWTLLNLGLPTFFLDTIVFNKIKAQTGGRLKFALSGGAPIPKSTQKFFNICVCPIVSGYGMTESTAIISIQNIDQSCKLGVVGPPVPAAEVKLVDVPDSKYKSSNRPRPQGEVWTRGPTVMKGYYKQPELTKEAITEDGWLMTGDIGEWQPDGNLSIIDRKKNLVKLANGEYIALEKLESIYKTSPFITNLIVYGDSEQSYCVAVVLPVEKEIQRVAKEKNLVPNPEAVELAELCKKKEVAAAVLASMKEVAKAMDLKPAEVVQGVFVCGDEWTPQNGMLTAAMKIKRKDVVAKYQGEIDKLYNK